MGKRKTAKQAPKKKKYVLPTEFNCTLCDHEQCIEIKLYKKQGIGKLKCR